MQEEKSRKKNPKEANRRTDDRVRPRMTVE